MDLGSDSRQPALTQRAHHPHGLAASLSRLHIGDHQLLMHLALGAVLTSSIFFGILMLTQH